MSISSKILRSDEINVQLMYNYLSGTYKKPIKNAVKFIYYYNIDCLLRNDSLLFNPFLVIKEPWKK